MPRIRGRFKSHRSISISSSSSTSQASEDRAPESDGNTKPRQRGFSTPNMSERQMKKINSGSYGMFNGSPTLSSPSKTPRSRKRRNPQTPTKSGGRVRDRVYVVVDDGEAQRARRTDEANQRVTDDSLFIPEADVHEQSGVRQQSAAVDDPIPNPDTDTTADADVDPDTELYSDMPSERKTRAQNYMRALATMQIGGSAVATAEAAVRKLEVHQACLAQQLMNLEPSAAEQTEKIRLGKEDAIRQITEKAEKNTARVLVWMEESKAEIERLRAEYVAEKERADARVLEVRANIEDAVTLKRDLEAEGGFELAWDVRDVEERKRRRRFA